MFSSTFLGKFKTATTGHQHFYNRYIFGNKQCIVMYEESSATIILMKENKAIPAKNALKFT